jgi:type VI secretion system protein ImpH
MGTTSRRADASLKATLLQESYRFDFFQAVRLLERLYPERFPLGEANEPSQEVVRLRARQSLSFPPSEIYEITETANGEEKTNGQFEMAVNFMGLTGPMGVLPRHYTELLMERPPQKALRDFLDIFNHRLLSLFYLAWKKYQPLVAFEKAALAKSKPDDHEPKCSTEKNHSQRKFERGGNPFATILFSLIGLGTAGLRGRLQELEDETFMLYAGLMAQRPLSASALAGLLQDYFGVTIKVEQFQGRWLSLEADDGSRLGDEGSNNALGVSTALGDQIWDQQTKFKITVGPIDMEKLFAFLPTGEAYHALGWMTRFLVGDALDFDIQVILQSNGIPEWQLGDNGKQAPRLGWCTWLAKETAKIKKQKEKRKEVDTSIEKTKEFYGKRRSEIVDQPAEYDVPQRIRSGRRALSVAAAQ